MDITQTDQTLNLELHNGIPVVTSLDIAQRFEKRHADILNVIRKVTSETTQEFAERNFSLSYKINTLANGRSEPYYDLTRDGFSLIAMGFTGEKAIQWKVKYIEAFNAMEKELLKRSTQAIPNFNNPAAAARAWAEAYEAKEVAEQKKLALEAQAALDRPKVIFANAVDSSKTSILIGDFAKILRQNGIEMGQNRLFTSLREQGYLMSKGESHNMPTQRSMELGLFNIQERTITRPSGSTRIVMTTRMTGKGQLYFMGKFKQVEAV